MILITHSYRHQTKASLKHHKLPSMTETREIKKAPCRQDLRLHLAFVHRNTGTSSILPNIWNAAKERRFESRRGCITAALKMFARVWCSLTRAHARLTESDLCSRSSHRVGTLYAFFLEDVQLLSSPGGVQKLFTSPHRINDLRRLDAVRSPALSLAYPRLV